MFMKPNAAPGTRYWHAPYMFQKPCKLLLEYPDGSRVVMGYGIGDVIKVVSPAVQTLQASHEEVEFIELHDGAKAFKIEGEEYVAKFDYSEGGACDCKCHSPYDPLARDEVFAVHREPCCGPELQEHINREYRERQLNAPVTVLKSC